VTSKGFQDEDHTQVHVHSKTVKGKITVNTEGELSAGWVSARFQHGEKNFVHLRNDFKDNVASIGFRS
jgi:hypothetical protein